MSIYRDEIHCRIDPEQITEHPAGRLTQEVSVIMTDDYETSVARGLYHRPPSICTLSSDDARELAFELLAAAEHAESCGEWSRR